MKSIGIVRKIDDLGRVVIPKELRKIMGINKKDPMEIYVEEDKIIFKKYSPGCVFCDSVENLVNFKGEEICKSCLKNLHEENDNQDSLGQT